MVKNAKWSVYRAMIERDIKATKELLEDRIDETINNHLQELYCELDWIDYEISELTKGDKYEVEGIEYDEV